MSAIVVALAMIFLKEQEQKEKQIIPRCPACGCFTEYTRISDDWNEFGLYGDKCNNCDWDSYGG